MKLNTRFLQALTLLFFLIFASKGIVFADTEAQVSPRVTLIDDNHSRVYVPAVLPGSWKYPLKIWRDRFFELVLAFDPLERSHFRLSLAHKRLLEIQELYERREFNKAASLVEQYQKLMEHVFLFADRLKGEEKENEVFMTSLYLSLPQQKKVIERIKFLSPKSEKEELRLKELEGTFSSFVEKANLYWGLDQLKKVQQEGDEK